MSRLETDLNVITQDSSELEMQFDQYLRVRVGRDEKQLDNALREMMELLYDLSSVEPTLKEACRKWEITILLYTGVLKQLS